VGWGSMAPATASVVGAIEGGGVDETAASRRRGDGLAKVGRWGIAVGDLGSVDLKFFEPPAPRRGGNGNAESTRGRVVRIFT
jgi:hypothetical protein